MDTDARRMSREIATQIMLRALFGALQRADPAMAPEAAIEALEAQLTALFSRRAGDALNDAMLEEAKVFIRETLSEE